MRRVWRYRCPLSINLATHVGIIVIFALHVVRSRLHMSAVSASHGSRAHVNITSLIHKGHLFGKNSVLVCECGKACLFNFEFRNQGTCRARCRYHWLMHFAVALLGLGCAVFVSVVASRCDVAAFPWIIVILFGHSDRHAKGDAATVVAPVGEAIVVAAVAESSVDEATVVEATVASGKRVRVYSPRLLHLLRWTTAIQFHHRFP